MARNKPPFSRENGAKDLLRGRSCSQGNGFYERVSLTLISVTG